VKSSLLALNVEGNDNGKHSKGDGHEAKEYAKETMVGGTLPV